MRYWEFLIQQEGDQTWLPLETRQVEILEGRYRMAAHTSYDSTSVEVRVSQLLLDEIPPRRRVRKRKANTNDSGLLAIFPFIKLSPGRWEIECNSPNVIDDFLGEGGWHYSVQLQVTPRDEDDWEPNWSEATVDHRRSLDAEVSAEQPAAGISDIALGDAQSPDVQLQLKQQAYVTELGQTLTLTGHLSQTAGSPLANGQLWVELRDPQTASTVTEKAFDLPKALPSPFSVTIALPEELSTQVILGAISLLSPDGSVEKTALVSASFTVTIGLAQMLDAIANQPDLDFEEEISIFPGSTEAFVPSPEKSEALLTSDTPIVPKEIIPSEGLTLPPQIKPPSDVDLDPDRQPELPTFQVNADSSPTKAETESLLTDQADEVADTIAENPSEDSPATDPIIDADPEAMRSIELGTAMEDTKVEEPPMDEPLPFAEPRVAEPRVFGLSSIEDDDLDLEVANAALKQDVAPAAVVVNRPTRLPEPDSASKESKEPQWEPATDSIDQAFQKLQLRERFWKKLNLLTQEGYRQSLEVKQALHPSEAQQPLEDKGNQQTQTNEFVAYAPPKRSPWPEQRKVAQEVDDPIQVFPPILDVPEQELIAGEWMAIKVRVPAGDYQPYVKVWMNDLQTRTMIDSPRLLMQFIPNDSNELETLMRVQIPHGCLELQVAAISIDMATLQESRKVVQNRRVMPPDDSLSIFDGWDI
ncbi:hypothetical protein QGP82_31655 [Leptothoe sp. LEGE 181152]|nr:hypothetical protein [Leptothoe sp. LEGE 181152]